MRQLLLIITRFLSECDIFLTNRLITDYYVSWLGKDLCQQDASAIYTRL